MWPALYKSLEIGAPDGKALPRPTPADLDRAEAKIGARLPASYRAFAAVFGLGEHSRYFRIHVPLPAAKYPDSDLASSVRRLREAFVPSASGPVETRFFQRMIPFADTIGGDIIVFDPQPPRAKPSAEYPVLVLIRQAGSARKLAPSFEAFVGGVVYGAGLSKVIKRKEPWVAERRFDPYGTKTRGL